MDPPPCFLTDACSLDPNVYGVVDEEIGGDDGVLYTEPLGGTFSAPH